MLQKLRTPALLAISLSLTPAMLNASPSSVSTQEAATSNVTEQASPLTTQVKEWTIRAMEFQPLVEGDETKFIHAAAEFQKAFSENDAIQLTPGQKTLLRKSMFSGEIFGAYASFAQGQPGLAQLNDKAKSLGFSHFQEFADIADRIQKIMIAASFVESSISLSQPRDEEKEANMFEYLESDATPLNRREELKASFYEIIGDYPTNKADTDFVSQHYTALKKAL